MIRVTLNGKEQRLPGPLHVREALEHLAIDPARVAVEVNRRIIRRAEWQEITLQEGDVIEVVQFVGGG